MLAVFAGFYLLFFLILMEKSKNTKKMISTREQHIKHLLAGQNTQHVTGKWKMCDRFLRVYKTAHGHLVLVLSLVLYILTSKLVLLNTCVTSQKTGKNTFLWTSKTVKKT